MSTANKSPERSGSPSKAVAEDNAEGPRQSAVEKFLSESAGVKVNVRNLPWSVTEEELESHFSAAGEVLAAIISKRREKSLGYGYVAFANKEAAENAVSQLDKTNMGEREIKVQLFVEKTPEELAAMKEKRTERRLAARSSRGRGNRRNRRSDGPRKTEGENKEESRIDQEEQGESPTEGNSRSTRGGSMRGRGRRGRGGRRGPSGQRRSNDSSSNKLSPRDFDPTKSVYVGNLPWAVKNDELASIFNEYSPVKYLVPTYRYSRNKSKGYGIVEFASSQVRDEVLNDLDTVTVDGRVLKLEKMKATQTESDE